MIPFADQHFPYELRFFFLASNLGVESCARICQGYVATHWVGLRVNFEVEGDEVRAVS